jgi:hypothetical protein
MEKYSYYPFPNEYQLYTEIQFRLLYKKLIHISTGSGCGLTPLMAKPLGDSTGGAKPGVL